MGVDLSTYRRRIGEFLPRLTLKRQGSFSSSTVRLSCTSFCLSLLLLLAAVSGTVISKIKSQSSLPLNTENKIIYGDPFSVSYNSLGYKENVNFFGEIYKWK